MLTSKFFLVKVFLIAAVLVTVIAAVMSYFNYRLYNRSISKTRHLNTLIIGTTEILSDLKDAETGQRGYLLTSDKVFQEPYLHYYTTTEKQQEVIRQLSVEYPALVPLCTNLRALIQAKEAYMKFTIEIHDSIGQLEALKMVKLGRGKKLMDSIRVVLHTIHEHEIHELNKINQSYKSSLETMDLVRYAIQIFVIIIIIVALVVLIKSEALNKSLILDLNELNQHLEQKVFERNRTLEEVNMELLSQNEEIQSQTEQISFQNDALLKLDEQKNRFIGMATHDLKSPIQRIKGLIMIIQASAQASVFSQKQYLDMILDTIQSMQNLIHNMLDLNKIEQGRLEVKKENFDVVRFLEEAIAFFSKKAEEKHIRLNLTSNQDALLIHSDRQVLMRIIENLLSNAIKFSETGKEVEVTTDCQNDTIKITVKDQGPGIPENELPLLFGKFQKLSNRPTAGESSSGLGLSIVKELVESLGGIIYCESRQGIGSAFIIVLSVG